MTSTARLLNSFCSLNSAGQDYLTAIAEAVAFGSQTKANTDRASNNERTEEKKEKERE